MKEKIRRCKYCNSSVNIKTGTHNWKNLFRKPTLEEGITFFIILMLIFSAYAYKTDLNTIVEYYENETYCNNLNKIKTQDYITPLSLFGNLSNISLKEGG